MSPAHREREFQTVGSESFEVPTERVRVLDITELVPG